MIYIAGKISGLTLEEVDAKFQKAENRLHAIGLKVINPMKLGISPRWTWEAQMEVCLRVIEERATAILMLNDWVDSKGAKEEFQRVHDLNIRRQGTPILVYLEDYHGYQQIDTAVRDKVLTCVIPER